VHVCAYNRVNKEDGQSVAIKIIDLQHLKENPAKIVAASEVKAMSEVNHPGIIRLVDWFETPDT
jgi:serine/threonine protein kinase